MTENNADRGRHVKPDVESQPAGSVRARDTDSTQGQYSREPSFFDAMKQSVMAVMAGPILETSALHIVNIGPLD